MTLRKFTIKSFTAENKIFILYSFTSRDCCFSWSIDINRYLQILISMPPFFARRAEFLVVIIRRVSLILHVLSRSMYFPSFLNSYLLIHEDRHNPRKMEILKNSRYDK